MARRGVVYRTGIIAQYSQTDPKHWTLSRFAESLSMVVGPWRIWSDRTPAAQALTASVSHRSAPQKAALQQKVRRADLNNSSLVAVVVALLIGRCVGSNVPQCNK